MEAILSVSLTGFGTTPSVRRVAVTIVKTG